MYEEIKKILEIKMKGIIHCNENMITIPMSTSSEEPYRINIIFDEDGVHFLFARFVNHPNDPWTLKKINMLNSSSKGITFYLNDLSILCATYYCVETESAVSLLRNMLEVSELIDEVFTVFESDRFPVWYQLAYGHAFI